jgi:hypothetical protein
MDRVRACESRERPRRLVAAAHIATARTATARAAATTTAASFRDLGLRGDGTDRGDGGDGDQSTTQERTAITIHNSNSFKHKTMPLKLPTDGIWVGLVLAFDERVSNSPQLAETNTIVKVKHQPSLSRMQYPQTTQTPVRH